MNVLGSRQQAGAAASSHQRRSAPAASRRPYIRVAAAQQQQQGASEVPAPPSRRAALLAGFAGAAVALAAAAPLPVAAVSEPYLLSTGARGPLAEEEAKLLQLRRELESEVRRGSRGSSSGRSRRQPGARPHPCLRAHRCRCASFESFCWAQLC